MSRSKEFYPDYLVEILLVILLVVELTAVLALLYPTPLGHQIDFAAPYSPKPEWYFLWLYQIVSYFPGKFIVIGTLLVPLTAVLVTICMPLIDRGRWGRPLAVIAGALLLISFGLFTVLALIRTV